MVNNDKLWRRKCSHSITKPCQSVSLRAIIDRVGAGLPVNAKIAQHTPLPPDGDNLEDFETGTAEYIDIVDVQQMNEKVQAEQSKARAEQAKKAEEAKKKAFDDAVEVEILRRQQNTDSPV